MAPSEEEIHEQHQVKIDRADGIDDHEGHDTEGRELPVEKGEGQVIEDGPADDSGEGDESGAEQSEDTGGIVDDAV